MQTEPKPPAPAVVAVVVTCDPGSWFGQVLASLAAQDYPNLSILVIDAGSLGDLTEAVADVLPRAFIRRLPNRVGFGRAANEVLNMVEGASHLVICHDDAALAPDAVRLLVEEAFRSNAGIATPKFVQWDEPDRLVAVGATADKAGVVQDLVDPGELDQEQHDAVREVLVAPGGAMLIRADLFEALGGYDEAIDQFGEDLDLSWRARVAGARITTVPAARVMHKQAIRRGERAGWGSLAARRRAVALTESNRLRTVLKCYRWFDLLWILPLIALWSLGEALTRLIQGHPGDAARTLTAFAGAWRHPGGLWRSRRRVQRTRGAGDSEIRRLQVKGNARLRSFARSRINEVRDDIQHATRRGRVGRTAYEEGEADDYSPIGAAPALEPAARTSSWRLTPILVTAVAVLLILGTRSLFGHELPSVGQLPDTSTGWSSLWRAWWSGWQPTGLGVAAPATPALGLLGLLCTALFGAVGTLQHVVVLGPLAIGPLGAYRAARAWGSRRGQVAALIAYAVVPLPYNALARGHWGGLVAYAAAPWVLTLITRFSAEIPFPYTAWSGLAARLAGLGLLVAVVGSVAPSFVFVVVIAGSALLAGSVLAGRPSGGIRMSAVAVAGSAAAVVLLFPWSGAVLGSRASALGVQAGPAGRLGLGEILRFHTGPFGNGVPGWALLLVAALPLFIGRGWRLEWAARMWILALAFFAIAWAGTRGWIPAIPVEVALAPAAAALAASAALGAAAFELDLPGYRFGWRQLAAGVAVVALAGASLPFIAATGSGRWHVPAEDATTVLPFLPDPHAGSYRVLWVGYPDALPLAGRELHPGIAYATSLDGEPNLADQWVTSRTGAAPVLARDLRLVESGLTTKVGHLLAPAGVLYLVVPSANGPSGSGAVGLPAPSALLAGLSLQTDLTSLNVGDPNYSVFLNSAWAPVRSVPPPGAAAVIGQSTEASQRPLQQLDLSASQPVLAGRASGDVPAGTNILYGSTRSGSWRLHVEGTSVAPAPAFGWAMGFQVPPSASGLAAVPARLSFRDPLGARALQLIEILLWLGALGWLLVDARRRRNAGQTEVADPAWFTPAEEAPDRRGRRRGLHGTSRAPEPDGDEVWIDV